MENSLKHITIFNFTTENGALYPEINLSFQVFGPALNTAPIVLVNHALTGNSQVIGENGWWNDLIGENKTIDTNEYSVLIFNVPGNGFMETQENLVLNYKDFTTHDVAKIFIQGLYFLNINSLFAIIGGSVGGAIAWEMVAIEPKITKNLIPIASDWKATDWLIANCLVQDNILNNSSKPIEDARIHAMLCYRTPESFKDKFNRTLNPEIGIFNVESWLNHHGAKLQKRFHLSAYKMMNQLLKTIDITRNKESFETIVSKIDANIHIIGIDSDLFFTLNENLETYQKIFAIKNNVNLHTINSIHGHDAFLIEFKQLNKILKNIF